MKMKALCWVGFGATLVVAGCWKQITAGADIGLHVAEQILFWLFIAGCTSTAAALVLSFARSHRRRQEIYVDSKPTWGEEDAEATAPVRTLRLRVERDGRDDLPTVPAIDAPNVYSLAAWKERQQGEAVGRENPPA